MTTFEEQFPSFILEGVRGHGKCVFEHNTYCEQQILYFCLDKLRVREAIEKLFSRDFGEEDYEVVEFKNDLLKELGL